MHFTSLLVRLAANTWVHCKSLPLPNAFPKENYRGSDGAPLITVLGGAWPVRSIPNAQTPPRRNDREAGLGLEIGLSLLCPLGPKFVNIIRGIGNWWASFSYVRARRCLWGAATKSTQGPGGKLRASSDRQGRARAKVNRRKSALGN